MDHACRQLGIHAECRTTVLPLVGASTPQRLQHLTAPPRLVRRYGLESERLVSMAANDPNLLQPVADGLDVLGVELLFGLQHEGALTVDDLLDRRVRLGLVPAERARAADAAASLMQSAVA